MTQTYGFQIAFIEIGALAFFPLGDGSYGAGLVMNTDEKKVQISYGDSYRWFEAMEVYQAEAKHFLPGLGSAVGERFTSLEQIVEYCRRFARGLEAPG